MPADSDTALLNEVHFDAGARELFERIPGLYFFVKDTTGRLLCCNETHRRGIYRYSDSEEILGKRNLDFFPNALAAAFADDDKRVIETGIPLVERVELNISSNGSLSWFCTTKIPARDGRGRVIGLIGISRRLESADRHLREYDMLAPAIEYIQKHFASPVRIPRLASACRMSEATFRREFKRVFRVTPLRFIMRLRLHEACLLLSDEIRTVGEIASQTGFEDQNYFARYFKQAMGMSPTEFRQRQPIRVASQ